MSEARRCGEETIGWLTRWLTTPRARHHSDITDALLACYPFIPAQNRGSHESRYEFMSIHFHLRSRDAADPGGVPGGCQ
jgi:hypothetical protein